MSRNQCACSNCGKVFPKWMDAPIWCPDCGRVISTDIVSGGFNVGGYGGYALGGFGFVPPMRPSSIIVMPTVISPPRKPQIRNVELREIVGKDWDVDTVSGD